MCLSIFSKKFRQRRAEMKDDQYVKPSRRRVLKMIGQGAVILPVAGLVACSGGSDSSPPPATNASSPPPSDPSPAAAAPESAAAPEPAPGAMPRLAEDDPQAQSLSYVHDANTVDSAKQPRYKAGQICANCALYTGGEGSEWGGCSIFPGKAVNAAGWCGVYAPKA